MLNQVTLIGHLGQDPETKTLDSGSTVTRLSLATTRSWKNAQGEKTEKAEWHNIILWNKLGDLAAQYLNKGSKILIIGRLEYRTSEYDGTKRYYTDVVASEMKFLDSKRSNDSRFPAAEPARTTNSSTAAVRNTVAAQFTDEPVAKPTDDLPF